MALPGSYVCIAQSVLKGGKLIQLFDYLWHADCLSCVSSSLAPFLSYWLHFSLGGQARLVMEHLGVDQMNTNFVVDLCSGYLKDGAEISGVPRYVSK